MFYSTLIILLLATASWAQDFTWENAVDPDDYDEEMVFYIEKINGVGRKFFAGKKLKIPASLEIARAYRPMSEFRFDLMSYDSVIAVNRVDNILGVYHRGLLIYWAPITRARNMKYTTAGSHQVRSKARLMYSKKYGNVPMPYSLVVVGNVCIHQGPMVGYPASHGCIRLLKPDAIWLFKWARVGTAVIIE
jgi:hypothetical protein